MNVTDEMKDLFEERTARHIGLVRKYCGVLFDYDIGRFGELKERAKVHDASKYEDPEFLSYIFITWQYRCRQNGIEYSPPENMVEPMQRATHHHVTVNSHHPEFHSSQDIEFINRNDRNAAPKEMVDATSMPDIDIAEMVADWCAMAEELDDHPMDWARKNVNVRWEFTTEQVLLIGELIAIAWSDCD